MDSRFLPALYAAIPVALLIASLVTGKTMNPLRGARPFIVARSQQPIRYWTGVAILALMVALSAWIAYEIFSN